MFADSEHKKSQKLHFLAVDGTNPVDALAFCQLWQFAYLGRWENVLAAPLGSKDLRKDTPAMIAQMTRADSRRKSFTGAVLLPQGREPHKDPNPDLSVEADYCCQRIHPRFPSRSVGEQRGPWCTRERRCGGCSLH